MKKTIFVCAFILLATTVSAQVGLDSLLRSLNRESIPYIGTDELRNYLETRSVLLLDAREAEEYRISHIPGALHVGYSDFDIQEVLPLIESWQGKIVVYCSLGVRSEDIAEKLKKAGVKNLYNLYGGIFKWVNQDYPVEDMRELPTSRVHAYNSVWGMWLLKGDKVYE